MFFFSCFYVSWALRTDDALYTYCLYCQSLWDYFAHSFWENSSVKYETWAFLIEKVVKILKIEKDLRAQLVKPSPGQRRKQAYDD